MKMKTRKIQQISAVLAAGLLLLGNASCSPRSISVGSPLSQKFSGNYTSSGSESKITAGSTSGVFLGLTTPSQHADLAGNSIGLGEIGFGVESYETKLKTIGSTDLSSTMVSTTMANIHLSVSMPLFHIPCRYGDCLTLGLGAGQTKISSTSSELGTDWKAGNPTQFLASIDFNILPSIDVHLSYRKVSSHTVVRESSSSTKVNLGGPVIGIGVLIRFHASSQEAR